MFNFVTYDKSRGQPTIYFRTTFFVLKFRTNLFLLKWKKKFRVGTKRQVGSGHRNQTHLLFRLTQISCESHHGQLVRGGQSHRVDESLVEGRGENVKVHLVIHGATCNNMVK